MTIAACSLVFALALASGAADREASVEAGREALDRAVWRYPWYDPASDGVRAVRVAEPWYIRWEWLLDRLEGLLNWLRGLFTFRGGNLGSVTWLEWLAWALIAALLGLLGWLMIRAWRSRNAEKCGAAGAEGGESEATAERRRVEALPADVGRKRADLLEAARQCYQAGDYRGAVIYLFSHELVELDKHQLIRLAKGKTNRQYLRELGPRRDVRRLLEQTMVAFEDVFFGNHAIDRTRFESVWSRLGEFEAMVAERGA